MKISKKILAVICSMTLMCSMATSIQAADELIDPVSLVLTDNTKTDNTVRIDVKVDVEKVPSLNGSDISLKVSDAVKEYITGCTFSTPFATNVMVLTSDTNWFTGYTTTGYSYVKGSLAMATTDDGAPISSDGIYLSAVLTLAEGGIPATVSEADRTITIGGDFAGSQPFKRKAASSLTPAGATQTYYFKTSDTTGIGDKAYFDFDTTAEDNYVVLPTAKPDEPEVVYDGYVGDDDTTDVAIGAYYEFTAPANGAKGVKWTVEPNEGDAKTHVSAVDVAGGATYKLGLIIQGLAKSAVKSITAALQ